MSKPLTPGQLKEQAKAAARAARKDAKASAPSQAQVAAGIVYKVAHRFYQLIDLEKRTGEFNEGDAFAIKQGIDRFVVPVIRAKHLSLDQVQAIAKEAVLAVDASMSDGGTAFSVTVCQAMGIQPVFRGVMADELNAAVKSL